ncbi:hypothetical protein TNCV_1486151 [Trichonephila clavipes]|nr:hypothetical protein TNCV_1486151 [Trichonephila clavipes]
MAVLSVSQTLPAPEDDRAMPRISMRNGYKHVSEFDSGRTAAYRDCSLSFHGITSRIGWYPTAVMQIWNR